MERRQVVAVYRDEQQARRVADALRRGGAASEVRVGHRADQQQALLNEMQEEMAHTVAGAGSVGPFTKEMTKGAAVGTVVAAVFGALAALPFGLIEFGPALWQRLLIAAVVGGFAGATIGFVMGGGLSAVGPAERLGAERGVTVAVTVPMGEDTERVARVLTAAGPIRVDVTDLDGRVVDTVQTAGERNVPHEVGRTLGRETGDWSGARHDD